jgi:phosphatidylserine synthase
LILYKFDDYFGMPRNVVLNFILVASCLFLYSTSIYFIKPLNWKILLKILSITNTLYCFLTIYEVFQNKESITMFGYIYFIAEIIVVKVIDYLEYKYSNKK